MVKKQSSGRSTGKSFLKGFVSLLVLGGCLYGGYTFYKNSHLPVAPSFAPVAVDAFVVQKVDVFPQDSFVAKIEAQDKVGLRARVQGFLQERLFNEGDIVQKGQPLFVIEKVNFEANLREAEANVANAAAQVKNLRAQYERAQKLFKTKDVSESKLDEQEAAYNSAEAKLSQAIAKEDLARKDLEYTTIVSPMDGKIGESVYSVGELIGPDSGVLAQIVAINPIDAVFSVSENQLLSLQKTFGANPDVTVTFTLSDGTVYPEKGKIDFVDVMIDEAMNTLKIKVSFPNPKNQLISGQYGRVNIQSLKAVHEVVVPMRAVQQDMLGSYVYVINKDNKIEKREVVRGVELPGFNVVIESGLKAQERIVLAGFQKIGVGSTVQVQNDAQGGK